MDHGDDHADSEGIWNRIYGRYFSITFCLASSGILFIVAGLMLLGIIAIVSEIVGKLTSK